MPRTVRGMTFLPHWLLQFGGALGDGEGDIWSCGIRLKEDGGIPPDGLDPEQYLDDTAVPGLTDWFNDAGTAISLYARLNYAKCNAIGPDGLYSDPGEVHERFFTPVQGASSSGPYPYQMSVCYTWETDVTSRGPGSRGRIYVPMVTSPIDGATGLFTSAVALQHATSAEKLINSLDASLGVVGGGTIRPCIASNVGDGALNEINTVSCDTRFDVQRRRANAMTPIRRSVEVLY